MTIASIRSRDPLQLLNARSRWRVAERVFWLFVVASYFLFPDHLVLIGQILIAGLFALSLDLLLGYGGMPSLGHAAFFGLGAYAAGLLARAGWGEPITGLLLSGAVAGGFGLVCSLFLSRLRTTAFLMVTLTLGLLLREIANRWSALTGGDDGLSDIALHPLFGVFRFDLSGRTAFWYCLCVVFIVFLLVRRLVHSPFGLALEALRENERRAAALGISPRLVVIAVFTLSSAIAGISGALLTQTTSFVALEVFSFERSAGVLIMLVLGGVGTLYGSFAGAVLYLVAQDTLAALDPVYWYFWLGLIIVVVVLFAKDGLIGLSRRLLALVTRRWGVA
jgi:branched-chain amino acid transport system permease protein